MLKTLISLYHVLKTLISPRFSKYLENYSSSDPGVWFLFVSSGKNSSSYTYQFFLIMFISVLLLLLYLFNLPWIGCHGSGCRCNHPRLSCWVTTFTRGYFQVAWMHPLVFMVFTFWCFPLLVVLSCSVYLWGVSCLTLNFVTSLRVLFFHYSTWPF